MSMVHVCLDQDEKLILLRLLGLIFDTVQGFKDRDMQTEFEMSFLKHGGTKDFLRQLLHQPLLQLQP